MSYLLMCDIMILLEIKNCHWLKFVMKQTNRKCMFKNAIAVKDEEKILPNYTLMGVLYSGFPIILLYES